MNDFYFNVSGSIKINAQDQSRIELTPIAEVEVDELAFNVSVFDKDGTNLGNYPMEFINVKYTERLGTCTAL